MVLRKVIFERDGWSFVFLFFAFTLTVFSLFYADWYHRNVTGFVTENDEVPPPPIDKSTEDMASGGGSSGGSGGSSAEPSLVISAVITSEIAVTNVKDLTDKVLVNLPQYIVSFGGNGAGMSTEEIPSISGNGPITTTTSSPTNLCSGGLLNCQTELIGANIMVSNAIKNVTDLYEKVLMSSKKFPRNKEIEKNRAQIVKNLELLFNLNKLILRQLNHTVAQITARNVRVAQNMVAHEEAVQENKELVEKYIDKYSAYIPPAPSVDPITSEITITECDIPADLLAFDIVEDIDNLGLVNGDVCEQSIPKPKPFINLPTSGPISSPQMPTIPGIVLGVGVSNTGYLQTIVFSFEPVLGEVNHEAFAAALNPTGQFILGFFSSPSVGNLADEINTFVQKVVLGLHDEVLETKTASAEILAADFGRNTPWMLWIVLAVVTVPFIFFGNYLLPTHERLIFEGRRAIFKGDFGKAVAQYNELTMRYDDLCEDNGEDVRQEVLNYFILLKGSLNMRNVKFSTTTGENKFSNIVLARNSLTDFQRVENVLYDALHDLKKDRKKSILRAPAIAEMYSQLEQREKEKLAPLYEKFVYGMRR